MKEVDRLAAEAELLQAEFQMYSAVTSFQLKKWNSNKCWVWTWRCKRP